MGLWTLLDGRLLLANALAILNEDRFLAPREGYLAITIFIAALLPFLGDFMSLTGAFSTFPLTFHMYLVAKKNKLTSIQKSWQWLNVCFFGSVAVAAAISAIRLILVD